MRSGTDDNHDGVYGGTYDLRGFIFELISNAYDTNRTDAAPAY